MDFKTFKKEWADAMVYNPKEFDYENTMHELYIHYKHALSLCAEGCTVIEWCTFFHNECNLYEHPYMLKQKLSKPMQKIKTPPVMKILKLKLGKKDFAAITIQVCSHLIFTCVCGLSACFTKYKTKSYV